MKSYKQALFFQSGSIGDFLMSVYFAENLHESGVAKEVVIFLPRNGKFLSGFVESYPYIRVVEFSRIMALFVLLRYISFRSLVFLQPTLGKLPLRLKFFAWAMSRLPGSVLIGFQDAGPFCKALYSVMLEYDTGKPFLETIKTALRALSIQKISEPGLKVSEDKKVFEKLNVKKPYIFFHPLGFTEKRSFGKDDAAHFIRAILEKHSEWNIIISGSESERQKFEDIAKLSGWESQVIFATGLSVKELASLILGAKLYVGVDTGITHLASLLGALVLCVAHNGTIHWLPFYGARTQVLYRFREDEEAHEGIEYLEKHRSADIKPFGKVPEDAVEKTVFKMLS